MKRRALLVLLALTATALGVELALQLAALVADPGDRVGAGGEPDAVRILCVGDSHTWGAGVPRHFAYPAQLERALAARHPDRRFWVINAGAPGVNSAYVARRLEAQIHALRPAAVVVWVGMNNAWNVLERPGAPLTPRQRLQALLLHSKLYRLATVLWYTRGDDFELGGVDDAQSEERARQFERWNREGRPVVEEGALAALAADLRRMVSVAEALDVPILFVTYPQRRMKLPINGMIQRTAEELGRPVVVTRRDLERAHRDGYRDVQLFVFAAGMHPNEHLYSYVVESILAALEREVLSAP